MSIQKRLADVYERYETRFDIGFFLAGFVFDVFTLSDIDDPFSILQQVVYLTVIGALLGRDFLARAGFAAPLSPRWEKLWGYRDLAIHFLLGSLLSVYSLFFLKSASFFSSIVFVAVLMGVMVVNELKAVQKGRADVKIALFVICVFSFFSMLFPVLLGFVGVLPFLLALGFTAAVIVGLERLLWRRTGDRRAVRRGLVAPGALVMALFLVFYLIGWVPPVPLSVQNVGVYHGVSKVNGTYVLSHENPWWRFWRTGDQHFRAEPGDRIYIFARIFSPGRFDDSVILHWLHKAPNGAWESTDRVPMRVTGGRRGGYRGFSVKQNYTPGEWRVSIETTDAREIGRLYFDVEAAEPAGERVFFKDVF